MVIQLGIGMCNAKLNERDMVGMCPSYVYRTLV